MAPTDSQIHGAFVISVTARFDNPGGGNFQRVFEFGSGAPMDNVWLGQVYATTNIAFETWLGTTNKTHLEVPNAIIAGETSNWRVGVDPGTALMWIEKNGGRLAQQAGTIPRNIFRNTTYFGRSL
jgi:hypothetical protein